MSLKSLFRRKILRESKLSKDQQEDLRSVFNVRVKSKEIYNVQTETLDENDSPVIITQSEFMRRMKEMSQLGGGMNFYGELPDSFNLVVNLIIRLLSRSQTICRRRKVLNSGRSNTERERLKEEISFMENEQQKKKAGRDKPV